jgi:predicted short-subunit dehydrogenase-like oxidoreductase (DUF2520 family)
MDRVVLIGAGRLAFHMGQALQAVGFDLIGLYNRTADNGKELAEALDAELYLSYDEIPRDADWYLVAVSDSAISEVSEKLAGVEGLVTHTSGSVDLDVLEAHKRRGVFYPLQTFSRRKDVAFHHIPMLIEANTPESEELLLGAAARISHRVERVDSYQRQYLHLAAVFACNFSNHMYSIAEKIMKQRGMKFDLLHPLIAETTQKALEQGPQTSQTGPAIRKDQEILNKHLTLLDDPLWKDLYTLISQSIVDK